MKQVLCDDTKCTIEKVPENKDEETKQETEEEEDEMTNGGQIGAGNGLNPEASSQLIPLRKKRSKGRRKGRGRPKSQKGGKKRRRKRKPASRKSAGLRKVQVGGRRKRRKSCKKPRRCVKKSRSRKRR